MVNEGVSGMHPSNRFNARVFILIQLYVAVWLLFVTNLTQWFTISLPLSSFPSPPRFSSRSPTLSCFSSSSVPQTQYNTGTDLVIYERIYILRFFLPCLICCSVFIPLFSPFIHLLHGLIPQIVSSHAPHQGPVFMGTHLLIESANHIHR